VLSVQQKIYTEKNKKMDQLKPILNDLKKNFDVNSERILNLENEIAQILETDLKLELSNMRVFDRVNNEKITPFFMTLAKSAQKPDDISVICDDTGTAFPDAEQRRTHISNTFEKLYKNPDPGRVVTCARFGSLRTRSYPRVPLRGLRVVYTTAHTLNRSISCIRSPNGAQGNATQLLYSTDEVAYQKVLTQVTGAQLGLLYTL
jgi:hypothetical protein